MKHMKRWVMALLAALLLTAGAARAEIVPAAVPDGHITQSIVIDGKDVAVDADIYGETVKEVQAYRVEAQGFGKYYQSGEYERLRTENSYFLEIYNWADMMDSFPEQAAMEQLEGFSVEDAIAKLEPMMNEIGVTLEAQPFYGFTVSLDKLETALAAHLDYGVSPTENVVEDWSTADEHYRLRLPTRLHGLPVMPWRVNMNTLAGEETADASVCAWISRQGVEFMDIEFVPGREETVGEPFAPISAQEALDVCAREARSTVKEWGLGEKNLHYTGVNDPRVSEMKLGYVLCPEGDGESCLARPAWFFRIIYDTVALHAVSDWGDGPVEHEEAETWSQTVAVDAETGDMLLRW